MSRLLALVLGLAIAIAPLGVLAAPAQPAPGPQPAAPAPPDSDTLYKLDQAKAMRVWGGITLGTGLALVAVSGVMWIARSSSLNYADTRRFYLHEQRALDRARRRHVAAVVTGAMGAPLSVVGLGLLIAGSAWTKKLERRASVTPAMSPGYAGLHATIRF